VTVTESSPNPDPVPSPAASGLRVIEIGESIAAAVAGMVLADYGAEVLMIEPPQGSRLRRLPAFLMWSRGKQSLALDLGSPAGRERLSELARGADVVITALQPATADRLGADGASLCAGNPQLVHCEVTGFGRGHPLSEVPGLEAVVAARGGRAHEFSVLVGGERPVFPAVPVATHGATMLALQGIFSALRERELTGLGQRIEVSLLSALSVFDMASWTPDSDRSLRLADVPLLFYTSARTRDGVWLQFSQNSPRLFRSFLRAIDLEHLLEQPRFLKAPNVPDPDDARALRASLLERIGERSWEEWQERFDADPNVSAEPFAWPGQALQHPQLVHTGDSAEAHDPDVGPLRWLGPLVTCPAAPARVAAPRLPPAVTGWSSAGSPRQSDPPPAPPDAVTAAPALLEGITVLEFATWIATPMATELLAELGARVIKVEPLEADPMRAYGSTGWKFVQGKDSLIVDLKQAEGREIVQRLAERADVLAHNYRPGVPERLGIDYATLRARNPRLIYLYAASYGSTGPMSGRPAFHVTAGAVCGGALDQVGGTGAPAPDVELSDQQLARWSSFLTRANEANPDFNAALAAAAAVTMALYARERTGEGQAMETRMMLSNAYTLSEHFIDYAGRPPRVFPDAGMHGLHALYRLYPAGEGWVFVAAGEDRDFARLCDAVGRPDLAADGRFATAEARARSQEDLVSELEGIFKGRRAQDWEDALTTVGVACVQAHDGPHAAYLFDAPWSDRLGFTAMATPTGFGPYRRYGRAIRSAHVMDQLGAADAAGAQSRSILAELGYPEPEIEELVARGVIAEPAPS
jgi:crotonobetainyl-CoA:carnitine CoA-transferase CaiB-like acyl-CoA transferase